MNETHNSLDETRTAETNANSGSTQGERPVSKKKKTSDDDNLVQVLRESIVMSKDSKSLIQIDYLCFHFLMISKISRDIVNFLQKWS